MDEQLAVAGLSRYLRVFDPAAMVPIVKGEPVDAGVTPHRGPECEVGGPAAGEPAVNPLVAAYFRAAPGAQAPHAGQEPTPGLLDAVAGTQDLAGTAARQPRALLDGGNRRD